MQTKQCIHIVAFDIPYPPDYGGVMDIFYKIKALNAIGYEIVLHCCEYGERKPQSTLNQYCFEVHYYPRKRSFGSFLRITPFIIETRKNKQLIHRLREDDYPILLEGLHHAWLLDELPKERQIALRVHNIEANYYFNLFTQEKSWSKKLFFMTEAFKLRLTEKYYWKKSNHLYCISKSEQLQIAAYNTQATWLPPFHGQQFQHRSGKGSTILFHGNLSVSENEKVVLYLLEKLKDIPNRLPFKIAGKSPSSYLSEKIAQFKNVELIANPSPHQMTELLAEAHILLVWAFQESGVKLKLLDSLFNGRFVVANTYAVAGSGLEKACVMADDTTISQIISVLQQQDFTTTIGSERQYLLHENYNDQDNARQLIESFLFSNC